MGRGRCPRRSSLPCGLVLGASSRRLSEEEECAAGKDEGCPISTLGGRFSRNPCTSGEEKKGEGEGGVGEWACLFAGFRQVKISWGGGVVHKFEEKGSSPEEYMVVIDEGG